MDLGDKVKRVIEIRDWTEEVKNKSEKEVYVHCILEAFRKYKLSVEGAQKYVNESLSFWPEVSGALEYAKRIGII